MRSSGRASRAVSLQPKALRRVARCWLAVFAFCCLAAQSPAGPWPRDQGAVFLSVEAGLDRAAGQDRAALRLYGEYGLTDAITLGAKLEREGRWSLDGQVGAMRNLRDARTGMTAFVRLHPAVLPAEFPIGVELQASPDTLLPSDRARLAVHLGHGFVLRERAGWARLSLSGGVSGRRTEGTQDLLVQAGLRVSPKLRVWISGDITRDPFSTTRRGTASAALDVNVRHAITFGLSRVPGASGETGVRLGSWHQF